MPYDSIKGLESPAVAKPVTDGIVLGIRTPPASRYRAGWLAGRRIADPSRTFGPYIDVLTDPDFALRKDPKAYDRLMRDCQVRSCIRLRQLATASRKVVFVARKEGDPICENTARFVNDLWQRVRRPTEVLCNILDAVFRGCSFNEVVWKLDKKNLWWYSEDLIPVNKNKFIFSLDGEMCLKTPYDVFYGETVPPRVFIHHVYDPEPASFDNPEEESRIHFGWGEGDRVYPTFMFKMLAMRLGLTYLDRLAFPIRIGRYPYRNDEAKQEMESFLQDMDHHRYGCWPSGDGWDFELHQTPATGHNVSMDWVSYFDTQMAKLILGSALMQDSSSSGSGSYAMTASHTQSVFGALTETDSCSICDTLENTWGKWATELNSLPPESYPRATQTASKTTSLNDTIDMMMLLSDKGYPVSVEQISETTGFRPARPGETLLVSTNMGQSFDMVHGPGSPFEGASEAQDLPNISDRIGNRPTPHTLCKDRGICQKGAGRGRELAKGAAVEMEHTDSKKEATKIAQDHLDEDPKYYTQLEKVFGKHYLDTYIPAEQSFTVEEVEKHANNRPIYVPSRTRVVTKLGVRKYATVSRHAQSNRRIKFDYVNLKKEDKNYDVEPYSFRYRRGFVYLYAYDPMDRTIKSFFAHKVRNVSVSRRFKPRWVVEIGQEALI